MADWSRGFEDPITLPDGRTSSTLMEADEYITSLPKAEQNLEEWQTTIGCLIGADDGEAQAFGRSDRDERPGRARQRRASRHRRQTAGAVTLLPPDRNSAF